ncbi:extracellular solute-binding protein [Paenibacillus piri]|uniref:Extracellular solute-binding protein n=1 Tax=Paenibacillus piri TaxID=2547395 RepID=A0A4R5KA22_9BACL|nr:extracellular solute-binding protein [Paenibacillus piri]TDF90532.1 extracellular solute-binding protein [Paenibacillus piri]
MLNKKRWVGLAVSTGLVAMSLSGCGFSDPDAGGKPEAGGASSKKTVKLKFWGAVPEESGPKQAVDNWNKAHPDIQVEYVRFVNDEAGNTKLETSLLAGGEVDLFVNYRMDKLVKRISANMVEPLDGYIVKDQFDVKDNFGDTAITKFNDKTYYIPAIILNDFVSINKSYLDEAKLPIPTEWTWDQYKEYAAKLTKGDGSSKRWGSFVGNLEPKIYEWMDKTVKTELGPNAFYKDEKTSNLDNPAFKSYLDTMVDMERNLKVQPPYAEAKTSKLQGTSLFLSGKTAMAWNGTAGIRSIKNTKDFPHDFVTAFAPTPKMTPTSKHIGGGSGYLDYVTINANSDKKDAAWQFLKWYVTEGNEPLISSGRVPAWKKVDKNKVASLVLGENPEKLFDVESFKRVVFADVQYVNDTQFKNLAEIQKIVDEEGERALIGDKTTAEAVSSMKKRADELLAKSK